MKTTPFLIALTIGLSLTGLPVWAADETVEPVRPPVVQAAIDVAVAASDEVLAAYDNEYAQLLAEVEALRAQVEQLRQQRDAAVAAQAAIREAAFADALAAITQLQEGP